MRKCEKVQNEASVASQRSVNQLTTDTEEFGIRPRTLGIGPDYLTQCARVVNPYSLCWPLRHSVSPPL